MNQNELLEKLQAPFPEKDIDWRVQQAVKTSNGIKLIVLPYVTNRAIQERLDAIVGPLNWRNEFKTWKETGVLCGISLKWENEWISKWDGADQTSIESTKGGFSASMKRAAVQWGIGRYLYDLDAFWAPLVDNKSKKHTEYCSTTIGKNQDKQYVKGYWEKPSLPSWATPSQTNGTQSTASEEQNQSDSMKEVEDRRQKFEQLLQLSEEKKEVIFQKANPTSSTFSPSKATLDELKNYCRALFPVCILEQTRKEHNMTHQEVIDHVHAPYPEVAAQSMDDLYVIVNKDMARNVVALIEKYVTQQQNQTA